MTGIILGLAVLATSPMTAGWNQRTGTGSADPSRFLARTGKKKAWVVLQDGQGIRIAPSKAGSRGPVLTIFRNTSTDSAFGTAALAVAPRSREAGWVAYAVKTAGTAPSYRICCSRFSAPNVYPPDVLDEQTLECSHPSVAITPADILHVVWQREVSPETTSVMYSEHRLGVWSQPAPVQTRYTQSHNPFTEAYADSVFAAWAHPDTQAVVYKAARALNRPPDVWSYPRPVSDSSALVHNDRPVLSTDTVVVWQRDSAGLAGVFLRIGDAPQVRISDTLGSATYPSAEAQIDSTGAVTVWSVWTQEADSGGYEVKTARYETEPTDAPARASPVYYAVRTGDSTASPYTRHRDGAVRVGPYALDFGLDSLSYYLPYFDPVYDHFARAVVYHEGQRTWTQSVRFDDSLIGFLDFGPGKPETLWAQVPVKAYRRDAVAELAAVKLRGQYSVMTDFALCQYEPRRARGQGDRGGELSLEVPLRAEFFRPAPNPFVRAALLRFGLSRTAHVSLVVYDAAGRLVNTLLDGEMPAGRHSVVWDGTSATSRRAANGVYFVRLRTENETKVRKLVLSR